MTLGAKSRGRQLGFLDASGTRVEKPKKARKRTRGVKLGRPPQAERLGFVTHGRRPAHDHRHPVHVSMRRVKNAPSFRTQLVYGVILGQLAQAKRKGVRVVQQSVQADHLHLIVEGEHRENVSAQMRILFSRVARAVNSVVGRRGSLFRDRHHREELTSPRQMRNALVYVLFNDRKHHAQNGGAITEALLQELDSFSSAAWLATSDWAAKARPPPEDVARIRANSARADGSSPLSAPETWLARVGWRERGGGPLSLHELPRFL